MKTVPFLHRLPPAILITAIAAAPVLAQTIVGDRARNKGSETLKDVFRPITELVDKSTAMIKADIKGRQVQVALGTIVSEDGFILTKASEVLNREKILVYFGDKPLEPKIVGINVPQDLAMLKVDAKGLVPVKFADLKKTRLEVGEWVAAAGTLADNKGDPIAVGVVSVERRKIPARIGFLGVSLSDAPKETGARIDQVMPKSAAEKAGLKEADVVTALDGVKVKSREDLQLQIRKHYPGDQVALSVTRGTEKLELKATLGTPDDLNPHAIDELILGGPVSKRSSDFPTVFQHDTVIRPQECGGPLVDIDGNVLGINIARAGRTETYALPADVIVPLLEPLENGKFAPVNANATQTAPTGAATTPATQPQVMPGEGE